MSAPRSAPSPLDDWFERLAQDPASEEEFWARQGKMPVVSASSEPGLKTVTFLFWEPYPEVPVMIHINGITDNHRTAMEPALLKPIAGTAVRHLTYLLPEALNAGYSFVRGEAIPLGLPYSRGLWKQVHGAGLPDPRNPQWFRKPFGGISSFLSLPGARCHAAWDPGRPLVRRLRGDEATVVEHGVSRRFQLWTSPEAPRGGPVLFLFDGEFWRNLELPRALARYSGLLPPVVLMDSGPGSAREEVLPHPDRVATLILRQALGLAERVLGRSIGPEQRIVVGQSYGGLAAATAVTTGFADRALVQSGSFQFRASVPHEAQEGPGDLVRTLGADALPRATHILVQVGTEEPFLRAQAEGFVQAATQAGHGVSLEVFTGGHDYAWWRHGLFFGLDQGLSAP